MRIVFAGTPDFARIALDAILAAGYDVPLVLTQPDRPSGRGLKMTPSAVKCAAQAAGVAVAQPRSLRLDGRYPDDALQVHDALQQAAPDLMVVAAYGLILPQWVLSLPAHGCFNIHASLLPRWRGAAPIQRAIDQGDTQTGVTIMQMDAGLDTGDMLVINKLPISDDDTAATLHDSLAELGAQSLLQALRALKTGTLAATPQPDAGVTYAAKLLKSEAALDFSQPAAVLARRIRAFNPVPGATLALPGVNGCVKVWQARVLDQPATVPPGIVQAVSPDAIDIATGSGVLRLLQIQKAGGKKQPVAAFVQGWQPGSLEPSGQVPQA